MPPTTLHPLLDDRSSPRSFDPGHSLSDDDLAALLEAARWAPSSMNKQPWRFAVARRGTALHQQVLDTLMPGNATWAQSASALLVAIAERARDGRPIGTADYDLGWSVMQLTVQAHALGLHVHQMGGFDHDRAARTLELEDGLAPVVVIAVGRRDVPERLPSDLRTREVAPRTRRELHETLLAVDDASGAAWLRSRGRDEADTSTRQATAA
jgi:nitroreductase